MRKKAVRVTDGEEYLIGGLSLDQVEEILAPVENLDENTTGRVSPYKIIVMGLNNPIVDEAEKRGQEPDPAKLWDDKKVRKEFDLQSIQEIKNEILTFSRLKQETETPGEATAVQ